MPNVIVTGSSRGIGLAIARRFSEMGACVTINCARSSDELMTAAEELKKNNKNIISVLADVGVYSEAKRLFDAAEDSFDHTDILVNNAGIADYGLFCDSSPEDWRRVMDANFFSALNCVSLAAPSMIRAKKGIIINISSVWGISGASCEAVYSASKGALNAFTKSMAKELAPSGVRVNAIACGVIDTGMNDNLSSDEKSALMERIPEGRFGKPEEVVALAVFLASPEAGYINGQIITLDGGFI